MTESLDHSRPPAAPARRGVVDSNLVHIESVCHYFGQGNLKKQILFDVSVNIEAGEIVILTGPSGSGKTTLLTLMGALRSAQEGSVEVLGHQLRGASAVELVKVRQQIGYIFQHHNLLESLTSSQNVQLALQLHGVGATERRARAVQMLEAVGLGDHIHDPPGKLSGGQNQRVAIARALVSNPRIILADEPTASLDKQSGQDVVNIMQNLAKERGVSVVLVTHDNRILDVADRIIHLEDGRLTSFSDAVFASTRHMMQLLAKSIAKGELVGHVEDLTAPQFGELLEAITAEARTFLRMGERSTFEAFENLLDPVLDAFTRKVGQILLADRASLWLLDNEESELWSKVARDLDGELTELRIPSGAGIVGAVFGTGEGLNIPDAYEDPRLDRRADEITGYRTRSILAMPLRDRSGKIFGVAQILNRNDGEPFDLNDEQRFHDFLQSVGVLLETWRNMRQGDFE